MTPWHQHCWDLIAYLTIKVNKTKLIISTLWKSCKLRILTCWRRPAGRWQMCPKYCKNIESLLPAVAPQRSSPVTQQQAEIKWTGAGMKELRLCLIKVKSSVQMRAEPSVLNISSFYLRQMQSTVMVLFACDDIHCKWLFCHAYLTMFCTPLQL